MESDGIPPEAPDLKPGSKADVNDDLKSLPLADVEERLGYSPDGLTQVEAAKRLIQYGPNEIAGEAGQPAPEVPHLLLGSHPLDDRGRSGPVRRAQALAGLLHHSCAAPCQCRDRVLGGTPGGQGHCRPEGRTGDQGPGQT